jgi:hypothetical protein
MSNSPHVRATLTVKNVRTLNQYSKCTEQAFLVKPISVQLTSTRHERWVRYNSHVPAGWCAWEHVPSTSMLLKCLQNC